MFEIYIEDASYICAVFVVIISKSLRLHLIMQPLHAPLVLFRKHHQYEINIRNGTKALNLHVNTNTSYLYAKLHNVSNPILLNFPPGSAAGLFALAHVISI